ncbi:MAG TPA: type II toxin-antitoxin system RelE/ParE family toxin [Prolixibacteraceae bacterium]|nr:type II toxin-antitoxin system RelE/ParE family toxin [Prolixibacteraceae bacterium]
MRKLILSKRASNRLDKLLEYLEQEWSLKVKEDFIKKLDKSLNQIQKFPDSCPNTDFVKGLHMLVVTKQTSLFYRFDSKTIKVVTIIDNRMNPDNLKKELK